MAKADEAKKKKSVFSSTGTDENGLGWGEISVNGTTYRMRALMVDESDTNWDAAFDERTSKLNGRLHSRLNLSAAIVTPPTSVDDMGKWPTTKLVALLGAWDELNVLPDADTEGNA
jgi:hypothetical protein